MGMLSYCLCTTLVPDARGGIGCSGLDFKMVASCHGGSGDRTRVLWKYSQRAQPPEPSL